MSCMKGRAGMDPVPRSEDPKFARSEEEAVMFVNQTTTSTTMVGNGEKDEKIVFENMKQLDLKEYR